MFFRMAAVWCIVFALLGIPALLITRTLVPAGSESVSLGGMYTISYIEILAVGIALTAAIWAASKVGER